jgi:hypothetical protein
MGSFEGAQGATVKKVGLVTFTAGILLLTGWVLFPGQAAAVFPGISGNCPGGGTELPPSGGVVGGVTISSSGQSVTISGGSATICVKAANCNSGMITLGPGTHLVVEWGAGNQCDVAGPPFPGVSHIQVYSTTTTTTTPPGTTTTPPGTTTTPPGTTTTVVPTTITPTDGTAPPGGGGTAVAPPGGTAFTGPEDLIPFGIVALALMTAGSGLLWAGTRRSRSDGQG